MKTQNTGLHKEYNVKNGTIDKQLTLLEKNFAVK